MKRSAPAGIRVDDHSGGRWRRRVASSGGRYRAGWPPQRFVCSSPAPVTQSERLLTNTPRRFLPDHADAPPTPASTAGEDARQRRWGSSSKQCDAQSVGASRITRNEILRISCASAEAGEVRSSLVMSRRRMKAECRQGRFACKAEHCAGRPSFAGLAVDLRGRRPGNRYWRSRTSTRPRAVHCRCYVGRFIIGGGRKPTRVEFATGLPSFGSQTAATSARRRAGYRWRRSRRRAAGPRAASSRVLVKARPEFYQSSRRGSSPRVGVEAAHRRYARHDAAAHQMAQVVRRLVVKDSHSDVQVCRRPGEVAAVPSFDTGEMSMAPEQSFDKNTPMAPVSGRRW